MISDFLRIKTSMEDEVSRALGTDVYNDSIVYVNCSSVGTAISNGDSSNYVENICLVNIEASAKKNVIYLDARGLLSSGVKNTDASVGDSSYIPIGINIWGTFTNANRDYSVYVVTGEGDDSKVVLYSTPSRTAISTVFDLDFAMNYIYERNIADGFESGLGFSAYGKGQQMSYIPDDIDDQGKKTDSPNRDYIVARNGAVVGIHVTDDTVKIPAVQAGINQVNTYHRYEMFPLRYGTLNPGSTDSSFVDLETKTFTTDFIRVKDPSAIYSPYGKDASTMYFKMFPEQTIIFPNGIDCSTSEDHPALYINVQTETQNYNKESNVYGFDSSAIRFIKELSGQFIAKNEPCAYKLCREKASRVNSYMNTGTYIYYLTKVY